VRRRLGVAVAPLSGCGRAIPAGSGAPVVPDAPAPPIVAVDESPPEDVAWLLALALGESQPMDADEVQGFVDVVCEQQTAGAIGTQMGYSPCPQPTAEEQASMLDQQRRFEEALRPAPQTEPRVIAKLPVGAESRLLFTAWTTASGALCWETDEVAPDGGGGGGGGPSGPCLQDAQATAYESASPGRRRLERDLSTRRPADRFRERTRLHGEPST
jgi:hypothetical protein